MRTFRAAALLALSLGLVAAASACGNSSGATASGAAVVAPASTAIFVSIDTDTNGAQWAALDALLAKFPDGEGAIDKALSQFGAEENLDFEKDIRPAVGDEIAIVGFDTSGEDVVLLTQPQDSGKLKELVASGDQPGVTEELADGWWAAAETQASLDRFDEAMKSGDSLADSEAYQRATDDLFEDAIASVYVNGRLAESAAGGPDELAAPQAALAECFGGDDASAASFALAARIEDGGVRIAGDIASSVIPVGDSGAANLDEFFRSDAIVYAATSGLGDALRKVLKCVSTADPNTAETLAQIQFALGVSLDGDIAGLFDGATGVAVYAPPAAADEFTPAVVVATEVDDEGAALELIDGIVERAGTLMGFMGEELPFKVADADIPGLDAKVVSKEGTPVAYYGTLDGKLVVTTDEAYLAGLTSGTSLADDPAYSAGHDAAGVPDDARAIVYVNVGAAAGLIPLGVSIDGSTTYGSDLHEPAENLKPLKSLFLWSGEPDDNTLGFEGFLQIE